MRPASKARSTGGDNSGTGQTRPQTLAAAHTRCVGRERDFSHRQTSGSAMDPAGTLAAWEVACTPWPGLARHRQPERGSWHCQDSDNDTSQWCCVHGRHVKLQAGERRYLIKTHPDLQKQAATCILISEVESPRRKNKVGSLFTKPTAEPKQRLYKPFSPAACLGAHLSPGARAAGSSTRLRNNPLIL